MSYRCTEEVVRTARCGRLGVHDDTVKPVLFDPTHAAPPQRRPISARFGGRSAIPSGSYVSATSVSIVPGPLEAALGADIRSHSFARKLEDLDHAVRFQGSELQAMQSKLDHMDLQDDSICPIGHRLKPTPHDSSDAWVCAGKYEPGGCKSLLAERGQIIGGTKFHCSLCDYTVCNRCHRGRSQSQLLVEKLRQECRAREEATLQQVVLQHERLSEELRQNQEFSAGAHDGLAHLQNELEVGLGQVVLELETKCQEAESNRLQWQGETSAEVEEMSNSMARHGELQEELRRHKQQCGTAFQMQDEFRASLESLRSDLDQVIACQQAHHEELCQHKEFCGGVLQPQAEVRAEHSSLRTSLQQAVLRQQEQGEEMQQHKQICDEGLRSMQICLRNLMLDQNKQREEEFGESMESLRFDLEKMIVRQEAHHEGHSEELQRHKKLCDEGLRSLRACLDEQQERSEAESQRLTWQVEASAEIKAEMGLRQSRSEEMLRVTHLTEKVDSLQDQAKRLDASLAQMCSETKVELVTHRFHVEEAKFEFKAIRLRLDDMAQMAMRSEVSDLQKEAAADQLQFRADIRDHGRRLDSALAHLRGEAKADFALCLSRMEEAEVKMDKQVMRQQQKWQERLQWHGRWGEAQHVGE